MRLKWINTIAFTAMIAINALANLLPLGGNTTGEVSEAYPNLFTPAPATFAIWGLIYLLMALFVVWQWEVFDKGKYSSKVRADIGLCFAGSCILNIAWISVWHNRMIVLSVLCIVLLLIFLIEIQKRLGRIGGSLPQRLAAGAGFALYYGWIIAATVANISVCLTMLEWNGFGLPADFWAITALLTGAGLTFAAVVSGNNPFAGLAVMWAYGGILYRHLSPTWYNGTHPYVISAAAVSELIILAAVLMPLIRSVYARMHPVVSGRTADTGAERRARI